MERQGLVNRRQCTSDGRGVEAVLTAAGYSRLERAAHDHVESVRASLIDVISDDDLMAIGRAFEAVSDSLETGAPDPILSPRLPHPGAKDPEPVSLG
jgi:DNA-binding MarR family transcriptional regulator